MRVLTTLLICTLGAPATLSAETLITPKVSTSFTTDGLSTVNGGAEQGSDWIGLFNGQLQLNGATNGPLEGWSLGAQAITPYGDGIEGDPVGEFNAVSNLKPNQLTLVFAWMEGQVTDDLKIRVGAIAPEQTFMNANGAGRFINGLYGPLPTLNGNLPPPAEVVTAMGGMAEGRLSRHFTVRGGAYNIRLPDETGAAVDNTEAAYMEVAVADKLLSYHTSRVTFGLAHRTDAFERMDTGDRQDGLTHAHVILEQALPGATNVFLRGGLNMTPAVSKAHWHVDGGITMDDVLPGGGDVGLGGAVTRFTDSAQAAAAAEGNAMSNAEGVVELTAQYAVLDFMKLQPDAQVVINPQNSGKTAWVAGLRVVVGMSAGE
ncbi:MAG: carbohydrate porin [Bradymonadia bacterium]